MNARALLLLMFPGAAAAQGYGGLGAGAEGFAEVTRPAAIAFPRDHAPHPDFRLEWWYLTAALTGEDGRDYGAQWTLFRSALAPGPQREGWESQQMWMGHAGLTAEDAHFHAEIFARGGIGQAGVTLDPFMAWIDDWQMTSRAGGADPLGALEVSAAGEGFSYVLEVAAEGPIVLHGEAGFSLKAAAGQASYYYSQPFYAAEGTIVIGGDEIAVTGTAWLDREWSSQWLSEDQAGWDWFSLHLEDGARLMTFRLRDAEGRNDAFGTWIEPGGTAQALGPGEIAMQPRAWAEVEGREVPVEWHLAVPGIGLAVDTEAVNTQSWMGGAYPYWEGPIRVTGTHAGRGFLEMTGYE
ncbi:lipocalin-like domain-containing protein [soil metagenome]